MNTAKLHQQDAPDHKRIFEKAAPEIPVSNFRFDSGFTRSGLLVLAIAVLLRFVFLMAFADQKLAIVDEQQYNSIALNILQHGEFADGKGRLTALRPPLYPLFLAAVYKTAGGESYLAVRAVQMCLGLGLGWICLVWARRHFDRKTATLAASFCIFYPTLLLFDFLLLTEILFTLLLLLFFFCVTEFFARNQIRYLGMAGLCLGLASLARSITYPMLLPIMVLIIWLSKGRRRNALKGAVLMAALFILTLSPWVLRNYHVFGKLVPVDTMGGWNVYLGNFEHTLTHRAWATIDDRQTPWYQDLGNTLSGLNEAEKQQWLSRQAATFIMGHPGTTLFRSAIKTANLWGLDRTFIAAMSAGYYSSLMNPLIQILIAATILLSYAFIVIGGLFGLSWRMLCQRQPADWMAALLVVGFTGLHAITFGHPRYLLPLIPLLCGYTAWTLYHLADIRTARPIWKRVLCAIATVFIAIWTYEVLIGSRERLMHLWRSFIG